MKRFLTIIFLLVASLSLETSAQPIHGEVTKGRCPITCKSLGVPKNKCREWRDNGVCYVEDLTRPRRLPTPIPSLAPQAPATRPPETVLSRPTLAYPERHNRVPVERPSSGNLNSGYWRPPQGDPYGRARCQDIGRISRPRIDVQRVKKTGNVFGDKYKVRGTIEGICLVEAGYFEDGRLRDSIPVVTTPEFRRFDFEVVTRLDQERRPEVRVYNVLGDRDIYEVGTDEFDSDDRYSGYDSNQRPSSGSRWRW